LELFSKLPAQVDNILKIKRITHPLIDFYEEYLVGYNFDLSANFILFPYPASG
jgi:hypothetical protein